MNGVYGTVKPAYLSEYNINNDIEILYSYVATRGEEPSGFTRVAQEDTLSWIYPVRIGDTTDGEIVPGAFNLHLPANIFATKGIYTIYIRPREIRTNIIDVGVLSEFPDVRGIVIKTFTDEYSNLNTNGALTGYRVEFFGLNNTERAEDFSIITSSNKAGTIIQNVLSTNQKAVRYRFDDASNLIFCTVSPSTSPSYNANTLPYIGRSGEYIRLSNTKFEPLMVEVEMVDHDVDTISMMLEGTQVRNLDNGLITTYTPDGEIYKQSEYMQIKTELGKPLYDIKLNKDTIIPQDLNDILNSAE